MKLYTEGLLNITECLEKREVLTPLLLMFSS